MFQFGKKKPAPAVEKTSRNEGREKRKSDTVAQLESFMGIGLGDALKVDLESHEDDSDEDEEDLENELLELLGEDEPQPVISTREVRPHVPEAVPVSVESVAKKSKTIPVDSNNAGNSEGEPIEDIFKAPPPPKTVLEGLMQRLEKYKSEKLKAESDSKARRLGRIIKQYEDAVKSCKSGKEFDFASLPIPPGFGSLPIQVLQSKLKEEPENTELLDDDVVGNELLQLDQSSSDDKSNNVSEPNSVKIEDCNTSLSLSQDKSVNSSPILQKANEPVQQPMDGLPMPSQETENCPVESLIEMCPGNQSKDENRKCIVKTIESDEPKPEVPVNKKSDCGNPEGAVSASEPTSVMEALLQRLERYEQEVVKAKSASNSSKERRMARIVKQYKEAISLHKKGRPFPLNELPTPPGFPAIPVPSPNPAGVNITSDKDDSNLASPFGNKSPMTRPSPSDGASPVSKPTLKKTPSTLQSRQLAALTKRQQEYKIAALKAKKMGDVEQAKAYLSTAHGFDKLIYASHSGLPVDMTTVPSSPEAVASIEADGFEIVGPSDCQIPAEKNSDVFVALENDLKSQFKMCMLTRDHFKTMGDIGSANRFESLALQTKKDLDALRIAAKTKNEIPKYYYENRRFNITECNTDLHDGDLEVLVIQATNLKTESTDISTYLRFELTYPSADELQTFKSQVLRSDSNPEYNIKQIFAIQRKSRKFLRFVQRQGVKIEIWLKGGFFSRSSLLGTATVKLAPLLSKCSIHEAFDVMDGRKCIGKLEVKVRAREPFSGKQVTQKELKWLTLQRI